MNLDEFRKDFNEFWTAFDKAVKVIREELYPGARDWFECNFEGYNEKNEINVIFTTPSGCGCCSDDEEHINIPDTVITEDGLKQYIDTEKTKRDDYIKSEKRARTRKAKADKEKVDEADRKQFEKLKKRFENPDS